MSIEPPVFQNRMRDLVDAMKRYGWSAANSAPMLQPDSAPRTKKRPMRHVRGQGVTGPLQRKAKRRANGKAQRRARKANRR